jgi:acetolactate synthase-1/2/3 large subunit
VNNAIDQDTILLEEALTNRQSFMRQIQRTIPGTLFRSGGSNLGWGLEAALGAKLASPDKLVVTMVGDGCFIFGCPTATIWAASVYHAPFLCIIFNNAQYTAPRMIHRQVLGPQSYCEQTGLWVGTDIKPSPDYAAIARACNAYGQKVEEPADLPAALKDAIEQVHCGKPAIIDVRVSSPF